MVRPTKRGGVLVIADEKTALVYRAVGCETVIVKSPQELLEALEANLLRDDISTVLLSRRLSEPVVKEVEKMISRAASSIAYIPDYGERAEPMDIRRFVLRMLGLG